MVGILKFGNITSIDLPPLLRILREAGYLDANLDMRGSYDHIVVKAWGGKRAEFKRLMKEKKKRSSW